MKIQGKVKVIGEVQEIGSKGFKKRELVITTDEQYPQDIMVEFIQDKTALLDGVVISQNIAVGINIRGREWINPQGEAKYFNSIQGWKIEIDPRSEIPEAPFEAAPDLTVGEPNDLPF